MTVTSHLLPAVVLMTKLKNLGWGSWDYSCAKFFSMHYISHWHMFLIGNFFFLPAFKDLRQNSTEITSNRVHMLGFKRLLLLGCSGDTHAAHHGVAFGQQKRRNAYLRASPALLVRLPFRCLQGSTEKIVERLVGSVVTDL